MALERIVKRIVLWEAQNSQATHCGAGSNVQRNYQAVPLVLSHRLSVPSSVKRCVFLSPSNGATTILYNNVVLAEGRCPLALQTAAIYSSICCVVSDALFCYRLYLA